MVASCPSLAAPPFPHDRFRSLRPRESQISEPQGR
jgi:hypothetical protein